MIKMKSVQMISLVCFFLFCFVENQCNLIIYYDLICLQENAVLACILQQLAHKNNYYCCVMVGQLKKKILFFFRRVIRTVGEWQLKFMPERKRENQFYYEREIHETNHHVNKFFFSVLFQDLMLVEELNFWWKWNKQQAFLFDFRSCFGYIFHFLALYLTTTQIFSFYFLFCSLFFIIIP